MHARFVARNVRSRIFKILGLSGLGWCRDGELPILPNHKIPWILLLTIYATGLSSDAGPFQSHREEQSDVAIPSMKQCFPV